MKKYVLSVCSILVGAVMVSPAYSYNYQSRKSGSQSVVSRNSHYGFYVGIGGGVDSLNADYSKVDFDGNPVFNFGAVDNELILPVIQAGYWGNLYNRYHLTWGIKAVYSYLNSKVNYVLNDNDYLYGNVDIQVKNKFSLLALLRGRVCKKLLAYVGAGAVFLPNVKNIANDNEFTNSPGFSTTKDMWGGEFQVGLNYTLNPYWFIETSFSYALTGNTKFDQTKSGGEFFNRTVQLHDRQFVVSLNRYFR